MKVVLAKGVHRDLASVDRPEVPAAYFPLEGDACSINLVSSLDSAKTLRFGQIENCPRGSCF